MNSRSTDSRDLAASLRLASFEKPPVVETVLGVQFHRNIGLTNAHLGAFWRELPRSDLTTRDWPKVTDAPTIESVVEEFGTLPGWGGAGLRLTRDPSARLQIRNAAGDSMIQLQSDRLHLNWLRQSGNSYPRYEQQIRPEFYRLYDFFKEFLVREGLGEPKINQWEVTYVNDLVKGAVWREPSDWARLFPGLPGVWAAPTAVRFESFGGAWHFEIPERLGRLHIEIKHLLCDGEGHEERMRLVLTARGPASDDQSLADGLDVGRAVIVRSFEDITSADAHAHWEITHEHS